MQGERRTSSLLECPAEPQLIYSSSGFSKCGLHLINPELQLFYPKRMVRLVIGIASPCKSQNVAEAIRSVEKAAFIV